jgi:regulator of replication initiation timing
MSLFAKIMVVVNFILAVVFLSAAGTFLGAMDNWKIKHEAEKAAHETTRTTLNDQVKARDGQIVELGVRAGEAEKGEAAAQAAQATQQESLKTLNEKNTNLQEQLEKLANTHQTVVDNNSKLQNEKAELQDQLNQARADTREARDNLDTANGTIAGLNQQLSDAQGSLSAQEKANAMQAEKIDMQGTALMVYEKTFGPLPDAITMEDVNGAVQAVDNEMDIYVISVGSKDKVKVGYEFTVHRGNDYVSTIVVDSVFPQHASCHTKKGMKKLDIKSGDKVATHL